MKLHAWILMHLGFKIVLWLTIFFDDLTESIAIVLLRLVSLTIHTLYISHNMFDISSLQIGYVIGTCCTAMKI